MKEQEPFLYGFNLPLSSYTFESEEDMHFLFNTFELDGEELVIVFDFADDQKGVFEHEVSGSFRSALSKYMYHLDYDEVRNDPKIFDKYSQDLLLILFFTILELKQHLKSTSYSKGKFITNDSYNLYIKYNPNLAQDIKNQFDTVNNFINILKINDPTEYSYQALNKDNKKVKHDISIMFQMISIQEFKDTLIKSIEFEHNKMIKDDINQLYILATDFLTADGVSFSPTIQYFERVLKFMNLVKPKETKSTAIKRAYKSAISSVDTILKDIHLERHQEEGVKIDRHLALLHLFNLFNFIPKNETIYHDLYDNENTKELLHDKIKDYMKNKIS